MPDIQIKLAQLGQLLDGQVVSNPVAIKTSVKGIVSGFPVTLEVPQTPYPFGLTYFIETNRFSKSKNNLQSFKLTILPKYARGPLSAITRFLFFEKRGQKIELAEFDSTFICKYDNGQLAKQFVHYPNVANNIFALEKMTQFNELVVKSDLGLYLVQPISFNSLDLSLCQKTFNLMAQLGQVLFESY